MTDVFVVGAATTRHGDSGRSTADLAYHAAIGAMADAGIGDRDIPAAFVGSGGNGAPPTADSVAVRLGLRRLGFEAGDPDGERELPGRVEHVSTSGGEALHHGWKAIEMDVYDLVLCIAADSAADPWPLEHLLSARATEARSYMSASGATVEHLARISAKNRGHGGRPVSVAQVLESEELAWPLTRLMVAPAGEGAAAVILASPRAASQLTRTAPRVRASLLVQPEGRRDGAGRAARLAYEASGLGPEDLDCAELEDVTAAAELAAYEDLQLAPAGPGTRADRQRLHGPRRRAAGEHERRPPVARRATRRLRPRSDLPARAAAARRGRRRAGGRGAGGARRRAAGMPRMGTGWWR